MNIFKNASEYRWELIGTDKETDTIIIKYTCPMEAVGGIIEEIFKATQGETSEPDDIIRERLKDLLGKNIIAIELIHKLAEIDTDWIERFVKGEKTEKISTKSYVTLLNIIEALGE